MATTRGTDPDFDCFTDVPSRRLLPHPAPVNQRLEILRVGRGTPAPTPRHVWRLAAWHELFPEAQVWAASPTPFTLENGELPFTGILGDLAPEGWSDDLDQLAFKGNPLTGELVFFHKQSRTVILEDLIQVHPILEGRPIRNVLISLRPKCGRVREILCIGGASRGSDSTPEAEP
jgi:hypothetical protein